MSKKYEISTEAQVLLKLLRIALDTEPMAADGTPVEPFPQAIDWREVIRLSYEQKVSALAVDGLKASGYDPREGKSGRQLEELNAVLKPWFEDVKNSEESYAYYLTALSTLCQIFSTNSLKPVILKGYGLSLDYPIPSHRGVGDIDVYLIDEDGKCAAEKGDELIQKLFGLRKHLENVELHSQFSFKGIIIENHYELVGKDWGYIEYDISKDLRNANGIYVPSPNFNEVFLMKHMFDHFKLNRMTLRQLCDYVTFLNKHKDEVEWKKIESIFNANSFTNFATGIHSLIESTLYCKDITACWETNSEWSNHIIYDTFFFQKASRNLWGKLTQYMNNPWHCINVKKRHWIFVTIQVIVRHFKAGNISNSL